MASRRATEEDGTGGVSGAVDSAEPPRSTTRGLNRRAGIQQHTSTVAPL